MLAPIALFCYRRLDVLTQTVEALKNNELSPQSDLIIFSDGYKSDEDKSDVEEVRNYIKTINGFKSVKIVEAPTNKGLANSIIDGVTSVVNEYGKIIVVEDDILTSPYFLNYMNDALEIYKDDKEVACITGYTYPIEKIKAQSFFIKGSDCWGWGTTKDGWSNFEADGQKLLDELVSKHLETDFNFNNSYPYIDMLKGQIEGRNNSWAIRWYASCYLKDKLCLYLGKSIVQNIGFGVAGSTHCTGKTTQFDVNVNLKKVNLKKIETKENKEMREKFSDFLGNSNSQSKESGNFIFKRIKQGKKRTILLFNCVKISYKKK